MIDREERFWFSVHLVAPSGQQPLASGRVFVLVFGSFSVFFSMMRPQQYLDVRIRSSQPYHRSNSVLSADGGHGELCARQIF
jgi:hypothetical protein